MKGQDSQASRPEEATGRRGTFGRFLFWAVGSVALAFALGFGVFATHVSHLAAPAAPRDVDAIIVLTGGQSRIDAAVDLLRDGKGRKLLISGVNPLAVAEDLRRATGAEASLFECCVDIDHAAVDTVSNAMQTARWVQENAFGSVLVVTNNYHVPRSMLEMRRNVSGVEILPYPVVNTRIDGGLWLTRPDALRVLFTEYTKYVAALVRDVADRGPAAALASPVDTAAAR